ncbi:MAG: CPBP family intramembrane metalloprotease [Lachnospiraceae bacterium]|nr:CPBP family intramembrane metalloprotease [Lachnospiraceae bacterium]
MNNLFEVPAAISQAKESQKGMFILWEILAFIGVFLVSMITEGILIFPVEFFIQLKYPEIISAAASGDMNKYTELLNQIMSEDIIVILSLFSTMGIILVTLLFCKLIQKRRMTSLGFVKKDMVKEYFVGLGFGFLLFTVAVLICVLTGSMKFNGFSQNFSLGIFLLFLLGYMIQGMSEEVLCRGYFMVSVSRRYPIAVGILANSLSFAVLHLFNSGISILAFINLVLFGVFASVYFLKRGSIWGIAAFHSVWNLVQGNVYGVFVSGMETHCSVFKTAMVEGRDIINGGSFGLEGGLGVTIVFIVGICILYTRKTVDKGESHGIEENV